jgi:hypothetical protein
MLETQAQVQDFITGILTRLEWGEDWSIDIKGEPEFVAIQDGPGPPVASQDEFYTWWVAIRSLENPDESYQFRISTSEYSNEDQAREEITRDLQNLRRQREAAE